MKDIHIILSKTLLILSLLQVEVDISMAQVLAQKALFTYLHTKGPKFTYVDTCEV